MARYANLAFSSFLLSFTLYRYIPAYSCKGSFVYTFFCVYGAVLAVWYLWSTYIYPTYFSPFKDLPQPKGNVPLLGQFLRVLNEPNNSPHRDWIENIPNDGLIAYRGLFNNERIVPTGPKALAEVLTLKTYEFVKPSFVAASIGRILGIGVLLSEGDEHRRQRKLLAPAFAFRHIKGLYPEFWRICRNTVKQVHREVLATSSEEGVKTSEKQNITEVGGWASRSALDIIGSAGIGQNFGALENPKNELNTAYRTVFEPTRSAKLLALVRFLISPAIARIIPIKRNRDVAGAADYIRQTCYDLIKTKRERLAAGKSSGVDILSVMMEGGGFSDDDIVNQLLTFLAAGHETTASMLTWTMYQLCKHPEMQIRLREEIRTHLPSIVDETKTIEAADIDNLPYLNAICQESLRLMSPVPVTLRAAREDTTLCGHFIPKDTIISVPIDAINKSKALWGSDSDKFDPERWMGPGNAKTGGASSNYAFMTFFHGPRSCIGQGFAKAEFACLVAAWIGRFETELVDKDYQAKAMPGGVTVKPAGGLWVRVKVVEGW